MNEYTDKIDKILEIARDTERPNFQQLSFALEEQFSNLKAEACRQLRLLMSAKLTNPPLPELKL